MYLCESEFDGKEMIKGENASCFRIFLAIDH